MSVAKGINPRCNQKTKMNNQFITRENPNTMKKEGYYPVPLRSLTWPDVVWAGGLYSVKECYKLLKLTGETLVWARKDLLETPSEAFEKAWKENEGMTYAR